MTVTEQAKLIGKTALITVPRTELQVEVEIVDLKEAYGATRAQIKAVSGKGSTWVDITSLKFVI